MKNSLSLYVGYFFNPDYSGLRNCDNLAAVKTSQMRNGSLVFTVRLHLKNGRELHFRNLALVNQYIKKCYGENTVFIIA